MTSRPVESKPVLGIVGGIGAGKSTAAAELVALGCVRVDGDAIGHELLGDREVLGEIRRRWPAGVVGPDGRVDREALARRVFADPAELEALNAILHPRIRRRMARRIAAARRDPAARGIVVDAAVLLEAGWDDLCTHLVFVSAPEERRLERVSAQRGWGRRTWMQREKSQISLDKKAAKCDYTIDNCSSVSRLREQIRQLFHRICLDVN
jgi:dephospho-CoA kinase